MSYTIHLCVDTYVKCVVVFCPSLHIQYDTLKLQAMLSMNMNEYEYEYCVSMKQSDLSCRCGSILMMVAVQVRG